MSEGKDRLKKYLEPYLKRMLFDELSDNYLEKAKLKGIMKGVPVPIRTENAANLSTAAIAENMACVAGCDPDFRYAENYAAYILKNFDMKFADGLMARGVSFAQQGKPVEALIRFRGALLVDPENAKAYYMTGRACKDVYDAVGSLEEGTGEKTDDIAMLFEAFGKEVIPGTEKFAACCEQLMGNFKAESIECFETATIKDPDLAEAFYFLGYAYANMGLYVKAKLTWDDFIDRTADDEMRKEITQRLEQLKDPVEIERGYNLILSGHYEEGLYVLEGYKEGEYANWWPLWYYLAIGYRELGEFEEAEESLKHGLRIAPSSTDMMRELAELYEEAGDEEAAAKYRKKIEIVSGR